MEEKLPGVDGGGGVLAHVGSRDDVVVRVDIGIAIDVFAIEVGQIESLEAFVVPFARIAEFAAARTSRKLVGGQAVFEEEDAVDGIGGVASRVGAAQDGGDRVGGGRSDFGDGHVEIIGGEVDDLDADGLWGVPDDGRGRAIGIGDGGARKLSHVLPIGMEVDVVGSAHVGEGLVPTGDSQVAIADLHADVLVMELSIEVDQGCLISI